MAKLNRREFLKYASIGLAGLSVAPKLAFSQNKNKWPAGRPYWDMPANAQDIQNSKNLEKTLNAVVNPFHQPNLIYGQETCYGGGDYDGDGVISQGDIDAAAAGTNDYKLDVNGNQIINLTDANMLQEYKDGTRTYLPGYWNFLQNRTEREAWLKKMLAIDKTDEKEWIYPSFISGDFAKLLHTNMFGFIKENESDNDIPSYLTPLTNGLFNIPVYYVAQFSNNSHGMNAVLTGDNPLNFNDWCFVEPQNDQINIKPGTWNIPYNSECWIAKITKHLDFNGNYYPSDWEPILKFNIDSSGNATYFDPHPNLLTSRPTVSTEDEKNYEVARKYVLDKIYPNPTNSQATINYNLPERNNISIDVYDMLGKKVNTLEKGLQEQGKHSINWNANNQPSGIYNIILRNENQVLDSKKLIIVK